MSEKKANWSEILALGVILALSVIVLGSVILNHQSEQKLQAAEQDAAATR